MPRGGREHCRGQNRLFWANTLRHHLHGWVLVLLLAIAVAAVATAPLVICWAQEVTVDGGNSSPRVEAVEDATQPSPDSWDSPEELPADVGAAPTMEEDQDAGGPDRVEPSSRGGRPAGSPPDASPPEKPMGERIAEIAQNYLGYRYTWGGASPRTGFDCSGFMSYVYQEAGVNIPAHYLAGMLNLGPRLSRDELQPGDLVFFENTYEWGLSHGGIYLGDDRFIHSVEPGVGVAVNSLNERFWSARFVAGSRPWESSPGS